MERNMTTGNLTSLILRFAFPVFLGSLFQQLYNLVDTVIVGQFLGVNALAGVGSTTGLTFLAFSLCNGICNGFSVPISQKYGQGDREGLRSYFGNGIVLAVIFAAALTALTTMLSRPVLTLTQTPEEIFSYAYAYILVIFLGVPCTLLYNFLAAHLRAIGDSRTPVIALVISSFLNIGLDLLFIRSFGWGVAGAAGATIFSQLVSGIFLAIHVVRKAEALHVKREHLRLTKSITREQISTAVPMGIQGMVIVLGILIVQSQVNRMGTVYVAGSTAGNKLYGIMAAPIDALAQSMIPISGQNFGAKKYKRIDAGLKRVLLMSWILTGALTLVAWLLGPSLIRLFIDAAETEVIAYGHKFLLYFVMGYGFLAIQESICFTLQGTGHAGATIFSGILETGGRIFGAVVLTGVIGYTGICLALPLAWVFTDLYVVPMYLVCRRRLTVSENERYGKRAASFRSFA